MKESVLSKANKPSNPVEPACTIGLPCGVITVFKESAFVIGNEEVWVGFGNSRMFLGDTLKGLLEEAASEWEDERHLVG